MQLALDTSTSIASIALAEKGEVMAELTWHTDQNHSVELLPNLNHLLQLAKTDLKSVDAFIVAKGPGSYNGLRVGLSTAKGLAFALEKPIVGVGTLEAEAFPHALSGLPVCVLQPAGASEIATATFQMRSGKWAQLEEERLTKLETLAEQIAEKTLFCGETLSGMAAQLSELLKEKAVFPSKSSLLRRAGCLAELGWIRLQEGKTDDVATLQPIYLRRPQITQPRTSPTTLTSGRQDG